MKDYLNDDDLNLSGDSIFLMQKTPDLVVSFDSDRSFDFKQFLGEPSDETLDFVQKHIDTIETNCSQNEDLSRTVEVYQPIVEDISSDEEYNRY